MKASITKLASTLTELERQDLDQSVVSRAQQLLKRLESLDTRFKSHHFEILDALESEAQVESEQETLDKHDDDVMEFSIRLQVLTTTAPDASIEPHTIPDHGILSRRLAQLQARLGSITEDANALSADPEEIHLVYTYQELVTELKTELSDIRREALNTTADTSEPITAAILNLDRDFFDLSVKIKKILHHPIAVPGSLTPTTFEPRGVKLPKIDVATFNGDLLDWRTFWEQFEISVHDRREVSNAEKLAYLRNALKDGHAKSVIEGLSQSGDQYEEAIASLKSRYDRPRLIHQAHVRKVTEAPGLKDGSGKEIRRLHDSVQQHLRALKAMGEEPSGSFITSMLELKLDQATMFEWQKASQESTSVPHYQKLLEFLNLRAQASETYSLTQERRSGRFEHKRINPRQIPAHIGSVSEVTTNCVICNNEKHPLYACSKFKNLPHDKMLAAVRSHNLCLNCFRPGHLSRNCTSLHRCKRCQKPHHTLLHIETKQGEQVSTENPENEQSNTASVVSTNAQTGSSSNTIMMTCQVLIHAPDGSQLRARGLLDSGSSTSFVSQRLVQSLGLPRSTKNLQITGIAGISPLHSISSFQISPTFSPSEKTLVTAIVVPRVTCDMPIQPVSLNSKWKHLSGLNLSDPEFGCPGRIDILLGVDICANSILQGRRKGPLGSPVAFETSFGWVLAGKTDKLPTLQDSAFTHHVNVISGDDILRKFWEIEESPKAESNHSPEERMVVRHFQENHTRNKDGRFIVPLPKNPESKPLGESRMQAVRRFRSLERSLHSKSQFGEFATVMEEYMKLDHAEVVPDADLQKPSESVFYLPMHAVRKEQSTTTKIRAVFDASAKSSSGISLNDTLLVGPTIHSTLIDVLLRFRLHRIALTADVSKMYRAIELTHSDRDLHRFVWRSKPEDTLVDYRMTRITFGVSASSFAANMSVKQNAIDYATEYPQAAKIVETSFYVDDCLTGADSAKEAIILQQQLLNLFSKGGLLLRKWSSNNVTVLKNIPSELREVQPLHLLPTNDEYKKTLGIEWNASKDHFRLAHADPPPLENLTKRGLASDVAKTYDILGWFAPATIKMKILLQTLWEEAIDWDDPVPPHVKEVWLKWRSELPNLSLKHIPRCYFDQETHVSFIQLHGFSDASEVAYSAVVYIRLTDTSNQNQVSLVMSKTKVAPIKRLSIPRLELCGAHLLAQLLHHARKVLDVSLSSIYAWTDSTIVLNWLDGSPKRFKTYVGNRISTILDLIPPDTWNHVSGLENPADCASRGLYPTELLDHPLWWNGPDWLKLSPDNWPKQSSVIPNVPSDEEREISLLVTESDPPPVIPLDRFSSFNHLKRVTSWIARFARNCRSTPQERIQSCLTTLELQQAENYWYKTIQSAHFKMEIDCLRNDLPLPKSSLLVSRNPFLDGEGLLRVGGRRELSQAHYDSKHPLILHSKHKLTRIIVSTEHVRLLHAGPTLLTGSLYRRYHIVGGFKTVRSITRKCVTCRKYATKPLPQMLGQLPLERITPGSVFDKVGVDYAGPLLIKYGHVRKPTIVKAYICIFVSLSVKAVHLELVTDLTSDAFIACLRRFIARRGLPTLIWSDNGTNFVGASRQLKEVHDFLTTNTNHEAVCNYLSTQKVEWRFIPQRAPHFGGMWEAAVKSVKTHLRKILGEVKLTYEEMSTVLCQIESALNSRPLTPLHDNEDGIEALTPGHFLVNRPLQALPDAPITVRSLSLLRRWQLCQSLVQHFWKRWSTEYLSQIGKFYKWQYPTRNVQVGDLVVIKEDAPLRNRWPLARVLTVYPGKDDLVRVAEVKTVDGKYTRPTTKLAVIMPVEEQENVN